MKKIWSILSLCFSALFLLVGSTYAWFLASKTIVDSATITSGQMEIAIAMYRSFDAVGDGSKDLYTLEEVNEYGAFFDLPDRVDDTGQYFAKSIDNDGTTYYNLYEKLNDPYEIILSNMVMSEVYSYIIMVYNDSLTDGSLFINLSGCLGGITPIMKINDQNIADIVDTEGNGRYYFTYLLDEVPPALNNGTTPEENSVVVARGGRIIVPFDLSLLNDPSIDQSSYMNSEVVNIDAKVEIEQVI